MSYNRYSNRITYNLYSLLFGYNERKYWKLRQRVVDPESKTPKLVKMFYLIYLKRTEAKNASSMGTALNAGALFETPPELSHGIAGIFIAHGARIGKNCLILQNVTIGSSKGKAPVIGDNCVIGSGAVIVGGIHIGNNCNIGANCTVFKDVPDDTTVVTQAPRYLSNRANTEGRRF